MIKRLEEFMRRKETAEYYWKLQSKVKNPKNIFSKFYNIYLYRKLMSQYNASIPVLLDIKGVPVFPHGLNGIFISQKAVIGENCTIFHQVTIGSNTLSSSKNCGAPKIGDNVYIGCGAKIIGGVTIGDNVRIGANCVVVDDVPDNSTVVMEKARIITHKEKRENSFVLINDYDKN